MDKQITPAPKPEKTSHLRTLANGAIYDTRIGRIVNGKGITTKITAENSIALHSRRQELKREALRIAANKVAMQGGGVDGRALSGDLAFVEAIGEAMTMKALTVNDPKAVDAARFIFTETGVAESKQAETVNNTLNVFEMPAEVAQAILDIKRAMEVQIHEAIDGDLKE
jgi:hypothetical protein